MALRFLVLNKMKLVLKVLLVAVITLLGACREEDNSDLIIKREEPQNNDPADPTPYTFQVPAHFSRIGAPFEPADNPTTVEGVALGKKLFFERMLSKNNQISCASCHKPEAAFNDPGKVVSIGADGSTQGIRNAMPLFNLAWTKITNSAFNWHGNAESLEKQAFEPVSNPLEMQESWPNVVNKLKADPNYPSLFNAAFGTTEIDSVLVVKALAQFERTLISGSSRYDNYINNNGGPSLSAQEIRGLQLFISEDKGDCAHCHGDQSNPLMTDFQFRNNGLDANPDSGLAAVTKNPNDIGKFKTPSVRNLVFTAPYMHDGRFNTLEEVVDFYIDDIKESPTLDGFMRKKRELTNQERADLVAFLRSMTDSSFVRNPAFRP